MDSALQAEITAQIRQRRTFAIISHPDAGKTTLTEKLLLFSGMVRTAGMVGGRKNRAAAASDWMEIEQERGISVTASAMQFAYKGITINVLDTPGHEDFCEDTYRTLTAADSVIMVLDAAKGIEAQTLKLFAACRLRSIPVFTFINKMDLQCKPPLELMEEVEQVLGISASARNWPIGSGKEFIGVYDMTEKRACLYSKTGVGGSTLPDIEYVPLDNVYDKVNIPTANIAELKESIELLTEAGNPFDIESFHQGKVTPVYFGSAMTNFGLELLFDDFLKLAPKPGPRPADLNEQEIVIHPESDDFSAYVFKLQANMNPRHRDCVAFIRINSGRFEKDMVVKNMRSGKKIRLSRPHSMMVSDRKTVEYSYPGDVVGLINSDYFATGDTILTKGEFTFKPLPTFQPELFARITPKDLSKRKAIDKGLSQMVSEGTVQILKDYYDPTGTPTIAAVGRLQFEVLQHRLKSEYGVESQISDLPYTCSSWITGPIENFIKPSQSVFVIDQRDNLMILFSSKWDKQHAIAKNPNHGFADIC